MEVKVITSAQNEYIKKLSKLKDKKQRDELRLFIAEGEHLVEMVNNSEYEIKDTVVTKSYFDKNRDKLSDDVTVVADSLFLKISDAKTPQGILAVVSLPDGAYELSHGKYIYCDCLQDPGNLGTIIRTADAFSFDGVIVSSDSCDVYSPKVIRSSQGSVFNISIITNADIDFIKNAKNNGFKLTSTALYGDCVKLADADLSGKRIFVIGNEGNGVSSEILELSDEIAYIPMTGKAESLNAGVAASILMYEVRGRE